MLLISQEQLKQLREVELKATEAFKDFNEGTLSKDEFKVYVKGLAATVAEIHEVPYDWWLKDINEQFDSFEEDPKQYAYLFSLNSSGSLLRQFEIEEYKIV